MFDQLFKRVCTIKKYTDAPLLDERLMYLEFKANNGTSNKTLREITQYQLVIMKYLNFNLLRKVTPGEIEKAAEHWAQDETNCNRKKYYSTFGRGRFTRDALAWFKMIGCLKQLSLKHKVRKPIAFEKYLNQYVNYMRHEQGLSERTIRKVVYQLKEFLGNLKKKRKNFIVLTPIVVDEVLVEKYRAYGNSRVTVRSYVSTIRSFLRFAENQGWCQKNMANSIKAPRSYKQESLPYSPSWSDVKELLAHSEGDRPTDIRDRAILMLLSIYGMRSSEVTNLRLIDIDWRNALLHIQRAKRVKPQIFPLSKVVGDAILRYITEVRPNNCALREIFLCMHSPYRALKDNSLYDVVSRRLEPLALNIKHHGPHALRHACATHLINEGVSLKEISDHLGHKSLDSTRIYTKVDLASLRKVAEFDLGDLL